MKKPAQVYDSGKNVLEAAKERISLLFDLFKNINVSVSGGKDSTVLAHLVVTEARRRGRKVTMFYVDEEITYEETVKQVEYLMEQLAPDVVIPAWFQVEFNSVNSTSLTDTTFLAWERGKYNEWMWDRKSYAIKRHPWDRSKEYRKNERIGLDFFDVIRNYESTKKDTAFIIGLRARESMNRFRSVLNNPVTYKNNKIYWSSRRGKNYAFYPLYDWTTEDIWKYIYDNNLRYHKLYDRLFKKGYHIANMRVSSIIDQHGHKALVNLPEFEPNTFNKMVKRIKGILFAQETANNSKMFKVRILPKAYKSWIDYRDFLLATHPVEGDRQIFIKRFSKQLNNEYVARQQVKQLILNDVENFIPVINKPDPREELLAYYKEVL